MMSRADQRNAAAKTAALGLALLLLLAGCGDYDGDGSGNSSFSGNGSAPPPSGGGSSVPDPVISVPAFAATAYPLLDTYCASCHAGAGPGSPNIAHNDINTAYGAVINNQKVNLGNPISSRLVQRLAADLHYCWSACTADAEAMRSAIADWATQINYNAAGIDPGSIQSDSHLLGDGVELDSSDQRYQDHLIALWEFKDASGVPPGTPVTIATDTSGVAPAIDMTLDGATFLTNYGLDIPPDGKAFAGSATARKLYDRIADPSTGSGQYSVEAWVVPANVSQEGPARIVSYSRSNGSRNFTMGQVQYQYDFRQRTMSAEIGNNGTPSLRTYDMDRDLQATLQHVVYTYDPAQGRRIYVDGVFTDDDDDQAGAPLWNWDPSHSLVVGAELNDDNQWEGKIQLLAVYDQVIPDSWINANYLAGVGRKVVLRFDMSQWAGAGAYVEFQVSELDSGSYLFCQPIFYANSPNGVRVAGLRIMVNGTIPIAGQAFTNIDVGVFDQPTQLSRMCSVIAQTSGPLVDDFSIDFEIVDQFQHDFVDTVTPPGVDNSVLPPVPAEGLRNFERINASMGEITGVSPGNSVVRAEYEALEQQLPTGFDMRSFVSSNQVGITKLALAYCDQLVESPQARDDFFGAGTFGFTQDVPTAFAGNNRDAIIDPLVDAVIGQNIPNQPDPISVAGELDSLITTLTNGCSPASCPQTRTRTVVKSACLAVLASAAVTLH